jgi:hypothetical protein
MKRMVLCFVVLLTLSFISTAYAETDLAKKLDEINDKIEKMPDDPALYYGKTMILMELGRRNEGYETAKQAMAMFIKKNDSLAHVHIERISLGKGYVIVAFNMTASERNPPQTGITNPLSFEVFKKDTDTEMEKCVEFIDYEVGMINGKPMSAAFRKQGGKTYLNFDSMDKVATYEDIRQLILDLVKKIYAAP